MAQLGGQTVPKKDAAPLSDGLDSQTPLRITEFKRDILGRLIHTLARNNDKAQETAYQYDLDGNPRPYRQPDPQHRPADGNDAL